MVAPRGDPDELPTGWLQLPVASRNAQCRDVFNKQGEKPGWFARACRTGCYRGSLCKGDSAYAISKSRIGGDQNRKRQKVVVFDLPVAKRQRADPNMRSSSSSKSQKPAPAAISQQKQTPKEQVQHKNLQSVEQDFNKFLQCRVFSSSAMEVVSHQSLTTSCIPMAWATRTATCSRQTPKKRHRTSKPSSADLSSGVGEYLTFST